MDRQAASPPHARRLAVVILAAGLGTRMRSDTPKVLHEVCGRPMLAYVLDAARAPAPDRIVVVTGADHDAVAALLPEGCERGVQHERRGSGDALRVGMQSLEDFDGDVLVLVGDGPLRAELLALSASLGVRDKTFFAGSFPPSKMADVYAGADLFLFASLTDTQGLVLVEAKAAGLPAVAVGALGVKDMVRHGQDGFLCENDPKDLSEKTLALLRDPSLRAKMSENAKKAAHEFSKESCAAKLLTCYESVIRQP